MRRKYRERFPRHRLQKKPLVNDPDMHHGTGVTHVMHVGIANPQGRGKRFRRYRCVHNPQFYVSGKTPIAIVNIPCFLPFHHSRDDCRVVPSPWETLHCNDVFHWLCANLESAPTPSIKAGVSFCQIVTYNYLLYGKLLQLRCGLSNKWQSLPSNVNVIAL